MQVCILPEVPGDVLCVMWLQIVLALLIKQGSIPVTDNGYTGQRLIHHMRE